MKFRHAELSLQLMETLEEYYIQVGWTVALFLVSFLVRWIVRRSVVAFANRNQLALIRVEHVTKMAGILVSILVLLGLGIIWRVSLEGLTIYFASFFTVAGIGLFASWSILSNVTAAVILFFYFPHKIGSRIKVLDGDNTITGKIEDITLFTVLIKSDEGEDVILPNNVIIQKTTVKLD